MSKPFLTQSGVPDTKLNPPFNPSKNKNTAGKQLKHTSFKIRNMITIPTFIFIIKISKSKI